MHSSTTVGVKGYSRRDGLGTSCVGMSRLDFQSNVRLCQAYIRMYCTERVDRVRERAREREIEEPSGKSLHLQHLHILGLVVHRYHSIAL